jgi:uncharacterized protein (DUF4213/DUF364 family)
VNSVERLLGCLNKDAPLKEVIVGAFQTAVVLESEPPRCGLSSSLTTDHHHNHSRPSVSRAGDLLETTARRLADGLCSSSWLEASIGMAALNALLEVDEHSCTEVNAREIILERGADRRVAIVGHFPFVDRVRREARESWVLELNPCPSDEPADRAGDIIPKADVVALSGTTLINHTFDELVKLCRPNAYVLILGASTPLTPLLFEFGVDAVSGTVVSDIEGALRAIRQGANYRQIPGRRTLTLMKK